MGLPLASDNDKCAGGDTTSGGETLKTNCSISFVNLLILF